MFWGILVFLIGWTSASLSSLIDSANSSQTVNTNGIELTLSELAAYNGQSGQPAYVAYDNVIYDVTNHPLWTGGKHNGASAGTDITTTFPHSISYLASLPIIGRLVASSNTGNTSSSATGTELSLTQLAAYNGKNGQPAYVAYNGTIYDVTNHPLWVNGSHKGVANAGTDITAAFPHSISYLASLPIIGRLVTSTNPDGISSSSLTSYSYESEEEDEYEEEHEDEEDEEDDDEYISSSVISISTSSNANLTSSTLLTLTLSELALYNGKNGTAAYVAYNGTIYDVTHHPLWVNGSHKGVANAGTDITTTFPHPMSYFNGVPIVGTLVS